MSLFTAEQLVQSRISSGTLLSLTYDGGNPLCCNCEGPLKYRLACGFKKRDKKPQFACTNKCRQEFFEKAKVEEDDTPTTDTLEEQRSNWYSSMDFLRKRFERGIDQLGYDEDELPKGIKITSSFRDTWNLLEYKEVPEKTQHNFVIPEEID